MSGINAAEFGDDEVSAFKTTVVAVLHGVEEEHVSNIVAEDGRRRQLLSGGCTISYDIQLSLSETSFSSAEYFASDLDEQISSSVSTGLFTAMLVATAGSTSALALATATAVVSVLATRSPTAVPPTAMPTFAPGGEQAVDRQWFVATGWKLWIALAALVIPTCYCFRLVHARAPGGSDKKTKVLPTKTGFDDVEAAINRDADDAEEEKNIKHDAASRRFAASPLVAAVTTDQELNWIKLAPEPAKKVAAPAVTMGAAITAIPPTVASYKAETLQAAKDDARLRFHKEDERQASGQSTAHEEEVALPVEVAITVMPPTLASCETDALQTDDDGAHLRLEREEDERRASEEEIQLEETKTQEEEPAVPVDVAITVDMLPTIVRYEAGALQKAEDDAHLKLQKEEDERRASEEEMQFEETKTQEEEPAVPLDVAITVDMLPTRARSARALSSVRERPRSTSPYCTTPENKIGYIRSSSSTHTAAAVPFETGRRVAAAKERTAVAKERTSVAKERMAANELTAVAAATTRREVMIKRIAAAEARTVATAARAAARKKDGVNFRWASRANSVSPDNGARNDAVPAARSRQRPLSAGPRLRQWDSGPHPPAPRDRPMSAGLVAPAATKREPPSDSPPAPRDRPMSAGLAAAAATKQKPSTDTRSRGGKRVQPWAV